jgi:hypothetical protein
MSEINAHINCPRCGKYFKKTHDTKYMEMAVNGRVKCPCGENFGYMVMLKDEELDGYKEDFENEKRVAVVRRERSLTLAVNGKVQLNV